MNDTVTFAVRWEERDDVRALAIVKAALVNHGHKIDRQRQTTCKKNGGLWQYTVPVLEWVEA